MHLLGQLQDEETPCNLEKFDGDFHKNPNRSMKELYEQYFCSNPSIVDKLFSGIQRSVVKCASCFHESIMFKPFSCLSLGFEHN